MRTTRPIWAVLALGAAVRVVVIAPTPGVAFDIDSYRIVARAFTSHGVRMYQAIEPVAGHFFGRDVSRWPYPPGLLPWLALIQPAHGRAFAIAVRLPFAAADIALAWLVAWMLGRAGHSERVRTAGAACVALGPVFVLASSYHGQLDSLAILPALGAIAVWASRRDRAMLAGLLAGAGGALKTVPILVVLALVPTARSRREVLTLVGSAIAVPAVVLAPFAVATPGAVAAALAHAGVPGFGGPSLALQPSMAKAWLLGKHVVLSHAASLAWNGSPAIVAAAVAAVSALLLARRAPAPAAAVLLWLCVLAASPVFFLHYAVWVLPFLAAASRLRGAAVLQLVLAPAAIAAYAHAWGSQIVASGYVAVMLAVWIAIVLMLVGELRRVPSSS